MNWLTRWWQKLWSKPEPIIQECRCWSSEVMEIATQIAIATEEKRTEDEASSSYSYFSPSGCDVKVYLSNESVIELGYKNADEYLEWHKRYKCVPEVQGVSFKASLNAAKIEGTLISVLFQSSIAEKLQEYQHLHLIAVNEYGYLCYMSILDISWDELSFGIAIDDIVAEERFDFSAKGIVPWQSVR